VNGEYRVLDGRTGQLHDPTRAVGWEGLLPLCHDCEAAHRDHGGAVDGVLLPDGPAPGEWPFAQTLDAVTVTLLDEAGEPARSERAERVIVRGTTPAARATVRHFALNTACYDEASSTFRVPRWAQSTLMDRRAELRTEAWTAAEELAEALVRGRFARPLVDVARRGLAWRGFWFTTLTVLRARLEPGEVARVLSSPRPAGFPGTRAGWP
jgi:hypothetical protein